AYTHNTLGLQQTVPFGLRPTSAAQVRLVVETARHSGVRLFPISTGKNWGYGSALSGDQDAVILDLSAMQAIKFNERDETFSLQPGVTQQQLFAFLVKHQLKYLVPTTGAGPNASVVGNLLDRGYGVTPIEDHFSSLVSLEAILPDGSRVEVAVVKHLIKSLCPQQVTILEAGATAGADQHRCKQQRTRERLTQHPRRRNTHRGPAG
ncbi:MAG: FAD-binding oxidoreductase, partial [Deltaproteobacteria bacterium]